MRTSHRLLGAIGALVFTANAIAQELKAQLTSRLTDVLVHIEAAPVDLGRIFSKKIDDQISKTELNKVFTDFYANVGRCSLLARSPGAATTAESFILKCQRGYAIVDLSIEDRSPFLIDGFWIRKTFSDAHPGAAQAFKFIPGLFYPNEAAELAAEQKCNLPSPVQMLNGAESKKVKLTEGFYWLAQKEREVGFAEYFHTPSMQIVEYGNNVFQANLLMVCPRQP